jgi:endonuclease-3
MAAKARKQQAAKIFSILAAHNPNPTTELNYATGFQLLVAVILSAQATDASVNKVTAQLFAAAPTALDIVTLGEIGLIPYLKSIGLYQAKAKNVAATAGVIARQYNGEVPQTREELEALPGVGRKTANVILNTLYRQPVMAVDTHVFRVANRLGIATGDSVLKVETKLVKVIPKEYLLDAHHWLILHGRYVCKARKPECENCVINNYCDYYAKTIKVKT